MRRLITMVGVFGVTLVSAASAQFASTGTTAIGTQDPNWQVSWVSGPDGNGTSSDGSYNAWVVPDVSGVWQPDGTGASWISAWPSASAPNGVGDFNEDTDSGERYIYTFTYTFQSGAAGDLLFNAAWDNIFQSFTLNGTTYAPSSILASATDADVDDHFGFCRSADGILNSSDYPNCTASFAAPGLVDGTNTISIVLLGDGQTDGLWMDANVTPPADVAPEPSTVMLFGSGLAAMIGAGARRRRSRIQQRS